MRLQDVVVGETYVLRNGKVGYVKALQVLKGGEGENTNTYSVVKCEHSMEPNATFGFIRYFRPCDLRRPLCWCNSRVDANN